ncbi:hypothetical protein ONZ45_g18485 [Pleurotus djamor]|nr:hypothetical protein ONZ45_g18485 [Pleurotus djamor]
MLSDTLVLAAIPTSLGVEVQGGVILPVVKRYTTIPTKKIESLTTTMDYQSTALIKIYEVDGKDSKLAGVIQMANLPSNPRGTVIIEVIFDVDAKLSVTVTATEKQSGQSLSTELAFDESVKFPSFDDPYTSTWAVTRHEEQPIPPGAGGPNVANPMPQPPHMGGRPFNFNQPANPHSNTVNFSQPSANPFNFSSSGGYGPSGGQYPPQGGEAYPHQQPGMFGPPPTTMPTPNPYANPPPRPPVPPKPPTAVIEERLVLMEEKYRLLEAKHEALEAKVRVLEMTLNTRR